VSPEARLGRFVLLAILCVALIAQTPLSSPPGAAGGFGGSLSSGAWVPYVPTTTHMSVVTSAGSFNQLGKTIIFRFVITGTSDGQTPYLGLPVTPLLPASLLQTAACVWTNDSAIWMGAYANPNMNGASFAVAQYNQVAPTTAVVHTYACNGIYEAQ
jgi:hypothetical protein